MCFTVQPYIGLVFVEFQFGRDFVRLGQYSCLVVLILDFNVENICIEQTDRQTDRQTESSLLSTIFTTTNSYC